MDETRLQNNRGMLFNTFARPDLYGNLDFGNVVTIFILFRENLIWKKTNFQDCFQTTPIYNAFEITIGSFHGFGKKSLWSLYLPIKSQFFDVSSFYFVCVKVEICLKSIHTIPILNPIPKSHTKNHTRPRSNAILYTNPTVYIQTLVIGIEV